MKKFAAITCAIILLATGSCSDEEVRKFDSRETVVATSWADLTLRTVFTTWSNTPTYTSRSLGYLGLTMYECVVHGSESHVSMSGQLNGLTELPVPTEGLEYNWAIALNAGQAYMLKSLYPHTSPENQVKIDSLQEVNLEYLSQNLSDEEVIQRSISYGVAVAEAIYSWSITDGGHEAYLHNFDPGYVFPAGPGYWVPPVGGQTVSAFPLHPYWGSNRTFVTQNSSLAIPQILPYSSDPSADYFKQFTAVFNKRNNLTQEEMNIAAWWADDPTQTPSPPGHSYNLASLAIRSSGADVFTAAETYAKVGMAVADAFINCWKCKYTYHAERPFTFIKQFIDAEYVQFWPEPPFPAFSSGHATQSAAAATVMESVFGKNFRLIDNTYENRHADFQGITYKSRVFANIWETAVECANSRFYGGIHTQQDNIAGQNQGKEIGENIISLQWKE
jgi:hypothetical protein